MVVGHPCDPSTWEEEELRGSGVRGQLQLISEFGTSLGYKSLSEKQKQSKNKNKTKQIRRQRIEDITGNVNREFSPRGPCG